MKAQYTRLITDENGVSKFEEMEIGLIKGFAVPPAEPLFNAPFLMPERKALHSGLERLRTGKVMSHIPRHVE